MVNTLFSLIEKREFLYAMEATDIVKVLRKMADTLYNDTCKYVS